MKDASQLAVDFLPLTSYTTLTPTVAQCMVQADDDQYEMAEKRQSFQQMHTKSKQAHISLLADGPPQQQWIYLVFSHDPKPTAFL